MNDYDDQCEICKIFSNPNRLNILEVLSGKTLNVSEIVKKTKLPQSVVSQQLAMMSARKILTKEKKGSFIEYKIRYPEIMTALGIMKEVRKKLNNKLK